MHTKLCIQSITIWKFVYSLFEIKFKAIFRALNLNFFFSNQVLKVFIKVTRCYFFAYKTLFAIFLKANLKICVFKLFILQQTVAQVQQGRRGDQRGHLPGGQLR